MMSQRQLGQADSGAQRLSSRIEHAPLVDESGRKYRLGIRPHARKGVGLAGAQSCTIPGGRAR